MYSNFTDSTFFINWMVGGVVKSNDTVQGTLNVLSVVLPEGLVSAADLKLGVSITNLYLNMVIMVIEEEKLICSFTCCIYSPYCSQFSNSFKCICQL